MHHPTDRITHTTAFVTPVVGHWLEQKITQWVHPMKDQSDDPSHHERTLLSWSYISLLWRGIRREISKGAPKAIDLCRHCCSVAEWPHKVQSICITNPLEFCNCGYLYYTNITTDKNVLIMSLNTKNILFFLLNFFLSIKSGGITQ